MNIRKLCGLLFTCMFLVSSISAVSASDTGIGTYIRMDSPITVHQGDKLEIKVELYGIQTGYPQGSDEWITGDKIYMSVYGGESFKWEGTSETNFFGNAYFKLNTANMTPGNYTIEAYTKNEDELYMERYADTNKKRHFTVLPKNITK